MTCVVCVFGVFLFFFRDGAIRSSLERENDTRCMCFLFAPFKPLLLMYYASLYSIVLARQCTLVRMVSSRGLTLFLKASPCVGDKVLFNPFRFCLFL
jgi:hypothetical protein